ncbi:general stress protein [Lysinibacillus odysseyi]|uniref:Uncharacterized protein n=1 Tax=Lysinibacillus odysseyi 34hs-1 = NBRC 100172 TaxID=1220589 RepID=A0A0A3IJ46_9BACI|nr:general stress protein [Lysinibacillus odysseyi]KGR83505.1 hypothetical protein CD32_16915 [Lysinibacillus odysseyi 34hs-1 = NBRC 100172]
MQNETGVIYVAHSTQEMLDKLTEFEEMQVANRMIHIITRDAREFASLKWDAHIRTHETDNWLANLFGGDDDTGLNMIGLSEAEKAEYKRELEEGAIIMYMEGDISFEPEKVHGDLAVKRDESPDFVEQPLSQPRLQRYDEE